MTAVGDTYTATIPATAVTAAGVEYYIQAADTATNEYKTPTYTVTVAVATLKITPDHAPPGASVSYSGTNFTPNKKYTLTVDWRWNNRNPRLRNSNSRRHNLRNIQSTWAPKPSLHSSS